MTRKSLVSLAICAALLALCLPAAVGRPDRRHQGPDRRRQGRSSLGGLSLRDLARRPRDRQLHHLQVRALRHHRPGRRGHTRSSPRCPGSRPSRSTASSSRPGRPSPLNFRMEPAATRGGVDDRAARARPRPGLGPLRGHPGPGPHRAPAPPPRFHGPPGSRPRARLRDPTRPTAGCPSTGPRSRPPSSSRTASS